MKPKITRQLIEDLVKVVREHAVAPIICPQCKRGFYTFLDSEIRPLRECYQHETQEIAILGVSRFIEAGMN